MDEELKRYRNFLKDSIRKTIDFSKTDQNQGVPAPVIEKPYSPDSVLIKLETADWEEIYPAKLSTAIKNRESRRRYTEEPLNLQELSFLLWAVQGVRFIAGGNAFRNVPSAGCRHALETYLAVFNVEGVKPGIYRYLPLTHELLMEFNERNLKEKMTKAIAEDFGLLIGQSDEADAFGLLAVGEAMFLEKGPAALRKRLSSKLASDKSGIAVEKGMGCIE